MYEEWQRMNLPMTWSIIKGNDSLAPIELWELDLRAGAPDGTYEVVCGYGDFAERSRTGGIVVADGEFDPATTAEACYRALCVGLYEMTDEEIAAQPPIHHRYIEGLKYDAEASAFRLHTGS